MTLRAPSASSQKPGAAVRFSKSSTLARFEAMSKVPPELLHALLELLEILEFHGYGHLAASLFRTCCRQQA
jgi:hypothetical protein